MSEELAILYRDDWLVAIDKPPGLLVHRTDLDRHETRYAVQLLRDQIGRRVHPVHRLDRGTSGVLLFALDADSARAASALFESGQVAKTYLAVVRGHPPQSGLIDHPLARVRDDAEFADPRATDAPKPAVTRYRRLATAELPLRVDRYPSSRYALLEVNPLTGRRHQIRRHLKHIAHPVIGDATYGKGRHNRLFGERYGCARLLLAAVRLALPHPVTGAALALHAPLTGDFARLVDALRWDAVLAGA